MSDRCLDERKMRGMMIGGGERDMDGGGKRGELVFTLGDGDGRLVSYKGVPFKCQDKRGKWLGPGVRGGWA